MEVLIGAIAVYLGWQYIEYQKFIKTYSLKIAKVGFDFTRSLNDGFKNLWVNITINVNNPTALSQSLDKIVLSAAYNGKQVGNLETATVISLKEGVNVYVLPLKLSTLAIYESVSEAIKAFKNKSGISIDLTGNAKIGSYNIPINKTIKVL